MRLEDYKSSEEYHFALWCLEASERGLLESFGYEPWSYPLSDKKTYSRRIQLKTKIKVVESHLLNPHEYTPDFFIYPTQEFESLKHGLICYDSFYGDREQKPYVIDVKGTFQLHGGSRSFSINQKWVFDKHKIYINKVIPEKFFKKTWVPMGAAFGKSGKRLKKYSQCKLLEEL